MRHASAQGGARFRHFQVEASPTQCLQGRKAHFAGKIKTLAPTAAIFGPSSQFVGARPRRAERQFSRAGEVSDRRRVGVGPNFRQLGLPQRKLPREREASRRDDTQIGLVAIVAGLDAQRGHLLDEAHAEAASDLVKNLRPCIGRRLWSELVFDELRTGMAHPSLGRAMAFACQICCRAAEPLRLVNSSRASRRNRCDALLFSLCQLSSEGANSGFHRQAYTRPSDTKSIAPATARRACFS